jgi:hypothetical protein
LVGFISWAVLHWACPWSLKRRNAFLNLNILQVLKTRGNGIAELWTRHWETCNRKVSTLRNLHHFFLLERHFLENNRKQDYTSFNAKQLRGILLLIHSTNKFIKYSLSPVWSTDDTNMNPTISLTSRNLGITKEKADMSRKLVTLTLEAKIGAGACL